MQDVIRRVEDFAEEIELLAQDLERQLMRLVVTRNEVDHRDVSLLAISVTASDALFDALGIPRQVVIDDGLAELEIEPLCTCFSAYEHLGASTELMNERKSDRDLARRSNAR